MISAIYFKMNMKIEQSCSMMANLVHDNKIIHRWDDSDGHLQNY